MFTEILRIIPRLDEGRTKAAELSLSQRFGRIATRFGTGIKNAIKGSVIGLSLAFLTKLLNPLQDMHDRIKKLLGENEDIKETAARFGTTPGELLFHQARAQALGVKPETFITLLESFRKNVEQRKQEVDEGKRKKAGEDPLLFQENNLAGFQRALNIIDSFSQTDPKKSKAFQRELFGDTLFGSQLKLIEGLGNVPAFGNPHTAIKNAQNAIDAASPEADRLRTLTALQEFQDRLRSSQAITPNITNGILESQQKQLDKEFQQLQNFETFQKAANVLNNVLEVLNTIQGLMFKLLAWLDDNSTWIKNFFSSIKPFISGLGGKK